MMSIKAPNGFPKIALCRIVHAKSGLFFNGYDKYYNSSKGKNTLSVTNYESIFCANKEEKEILVEVFEGNIVVKNDKEYIRNVIVYAGSEIHKILAEYYTEYEYLPIEDFKIKRVINM
ncbi:hypothetical protein [Flavobacterium sp. TAB 87]|uniref:hypothetical protein n=1 Tax=Flavobacterium sp. TAB 87 TaxID=1729581 RepID=UPI00076CBB8B|nr:hypothetical protein [Flavobacterium sp. TAB 87]KVV15002.1 hypothetical protein AP058_01560 [Flavobacterium sp. TAB 87]